MIISYYSCVLFHEWAHGTMAWLFGYKSSPFDIKYGGWLLLHSDEAVPYDKMMSSGRGIESAFTGISGISINTIFLIISLFFLRFKKIKNNNITSTIFFYWLAIFNLAPIFGYIPNGTFSEQGDVGRFVTGLNISPWVIFIPGTVLVSCVIYHLISTVLKHVLIKLQIDANFSRRIYLWMSLWVIFFLIYTHGYNPLSDVGATTLSKVIAMISIFAAFILAFICDPCINT